MGYDPGLLLGRRKEFAAHKTPEFLLGKKHLTDLAATQQQSQLRRSWAAA